MNASSPFNLHEILSIRCSVTEPLFCQDCESCKLLNKINLTKAWFIPLSHNNKKCFLERLILSSSDILPKLPNILISLQSKDYRYAKSRLHPSILDDGIPNNSDHSVNLEQIQDLMNDEYILWYEESTEWLRTNYLLSLLKLCSASLLYLIKDFAVALLKKSNDTVTEINVHSSYQITDDTQLSKIPKCKSAPILRSKSVLKNDNMKMRDIHSAKERITFMDEQSIYKNPINVIETIPYSFYRPSSQYSKMSSKTQFNFMQNTSARCTPILSSHRNLETPLSFCNTFTEDADSEHTGMDLIRLLPVQITKKIFGYLNEKTLTMISDVSEHWRDIAEQVMAELILVQFAKEDVMVIQIFNMNASSPFNLHEILSIRCSVTEPLFCQDCESCKLLNKINLTKAWFIPLSHNNKKCFLERLILSSSDILPKLPNILISLQSKDYRYAKSRLHPSILDDGIPNNSDHSVNLEQIQDLMNDEYILWYEESTEWLRTNYLLSLLKLCSASLLYLIKDFAVALLKKSNDTVTEINVHSSYQITDDTQLSKIPKCKSAPILRSKSVLKNDNMKMRDIHSAKERITFMDEQSIYKNPINVIETIPYSFYRPSSQYSKMSSKTQFNFMQNTSARCTPILSSHRNLETPLSFCNTFTEDADSEHTGMDLIRLLPVQITKKIFGYLNEKTLTMISDVSEHWRDIAEQVMAELILVQFAKEDVMVIQAASAKVPHPCYARYVPVHVPVINKDGTLEINLEGKHINVVTEYDEFQGINMEECFNDFETQEVFMEERNVYCSSYNVLVLDSRKDRHRHIHYGCGKYVIVGSVDRKLNLLNVETAQHIRSIPGHAGSIKCLCLDESSNIVASGGYDTSVRHKGSIVSLFIFKNFVVSSATDKAVKVWNLTSGKCKRTFPNPSIVRALAINDVMLVTGCEEGKINIWDIESSVITKTLDHHTKLVTCVKFTKHHIFSASLDCFAMLWSNIGDLKKPLKMYRHPREVLCLDVLYCRLITACSDGKIRVWNMLNGECLRVIRGNSKDDAITSLFCSNERFVVNTLNCILVYNFEKVELDYTAPRERRETSATNFLKASPAKKHSHAHTRAMKLLYHGSPIHQQNNNSNFHFIKSNHRNVESSLSSTLSGKISRVRSAPALSRAGVIEPTSSSILRHITRVKSANAATKMTVKNKYRAVTDSNSFPHSSTTPWEGTVAIELSKKSLGALKLKSSEKPRTQTRCRSAPVYLAKTLPLTISGFTTSSFQYNELPNNKMASKKQPGAQTSTRLSSRVGSNNLNNVKIKTSRLQLEYEEKLKKN